MAIKTNSAGIITHNSEVFSERGRSFGIAALAGQPVGMRASPIVGSAALSSTLGDYIYDNKSPTILYDYATLFNRGSYQNGAGVTLVNSTHTIDDSNLGLSGYIENQRLSISDSGKVTIDTGTGMRPVYDRSRDRSYLFVLSSNALNIPDYNGFPNQNFYRYLISGAYTAADNTIAGTFYKTQGSATFGIGYGPSSFNTSYSHTDGGSSETIVSATATNLFLFLTSYDSSAEELTYRWKQSGHRAGHSFYVQSKTKVTLTGDATVYLLGEPSYTGGSVRIHLNAVYDSQTTEEEFDQYASLLGF